MVSRKSIKILAVGNSFSDNAMQVLYPILDALGVREIVLGNLYIPGCSIETHAAHAASDAPAYTYRKNTDGAFVSTEGVRLSEALRDEDWHVVTMQQASGLSGVRSTYNRQIDELNAYLRSLLPDKPTTFAWHMTWAYQQTSTHGDFARYDRSQDVMYRRITQCVQEAIVPHAAFDCVIPAGTAIQNARTGYVGDTLTADGYHLDGLGEFIAGLTWATVLTDADGSEIDRTRLPQQFLPYYDLAAESVRNALAHPYTVTPSRYRKPPDERRATGAYEVLRDVPYSAASPDCKLDLYVPKAGAYATVVHFHGGGLSGGNKDDEAHAAMGSALAARGVAFASVGYRLYPTADVPDFFEDAAAAVAYVRDFVKENGGNGRLFVSGQSAGAYLSLMLCLDPRYLAAVGCKAEEIDGWVIESAQPTTHFSVLEAQGLHPQLQRIDEYAPLYYVDGPARFRNLLLISYTQDIACRLEQNRLLYKAIRNFDATAPVELRVLYGNHCVSSTTPYRGKYVYTDILLEFIEKHEGKGSGIPCA